MFEQRFPAFPYHAAMSNLLSLPERFARSAIDVNVKLSKGTESKLNLPTDKTLWELFDDQADELLRSLPDGAIVLDLGGGRRFIYSKSVQPPERLRVIAVDISADELALNSDVRETCVADVSKGLPLPAASVDLILSRALLEHVNGVPAAIEHMAEVLKPGGVALHMVPCRYSLFGMAARLLPFGPLLRLMHFAMPHTRGIVEFPVVYDHCWPQALERAFREAGFQDVRSEISWACPGYFETVFPLFIFQAAWEWTARTFRIRRLAAYTVVSATR
jgi:SAM-dependent methyltransferase